MPDVQDGQPDDASIPTISAVATLRRASHLVPGFGKGLPATFALASVGAFERLILPLLLGRSINDGFRRVAASSGESLADRVDVATVIRYCVIAAVATLVCQLCTRLAAYRFGSWSEWLMAELRRLCVDKFLTISLDQHAAQKKGVLVARVTTDVESIARFFEWGAISWLINSMIVLILSVYLLITDLRLGALAIVVAAPVMIVLKLVQSRLLASYQTVRVQVGAYLGRTSEIVGAAALIRSYGAQDRIRGETRHAIDQRRRAHVRSGTYGALLFPMGELFACAAVSAVVLAALQIGPDGGLTEGTVVAMVFATIRLLDPVSEISETIDQTQLAVAGLSRVLDVVDLPVELHDADRADLRAPASGPIGVTLDRIWYRYPDRPEEVIEETGSDGGDEWTLRDVTLQIPASTSLAIVGATGSGKSTVARLIARLADPQQGSVLLGPVDISLIPDEELRRRVQLVPQEPFLFDGSIEENVRLGRPGASPESVDEAVDRLGLSDWLASLSSGLATRVGERGAELSAGERQLVALLRAEVVHPDVLILDEATSSVDAAMEARLAKTIAEMARGRTMIVIAHRLSTAARADRIAVMQDGRLAEIGTHDELVAARGRYASLLDDWMAGIEA
jgi:ATP-binding cassette, subfamily B, bacterial